MNLYELASQDEAWGAYAPVDDTTPWTAWPADPPAPLPLDAALQAAAREYGVDADVLRALGHGGSVDSIFDTAASLRSRLETFDGDYAQALASYRQADEGHGTIALAAPAAAPLAPPTLADVRMPAPGPAPAPAPSARPRPARPQAAAPAPGAPPSQAVRPDQPPAPPDGRLGAADDPRSLVYRQAPTAQKPLADAARSQPGSSTDAASFAPARPEVRQALGNTWDAASPGERQRMQSMPGWQGQLARERAAQYAQADKGVLSASPTAALLDGRAESRAKAPPAAGAAPRTGGNERAQAPTAQPSAVPAVAVEPASLPQRSWGEAFSDTTKSVAQGLLDVASLPGVAYSAATGDYDTAYLNAFRGTQEVLQDEKSPAFQAQAQALQQKLATAEGWREKLAVGGWETLKNPTLLGDTLARSGPGILAGGLLGRAAGGAVDAAGNALLGRTIATGSEAAARSAVALKNAAPAMASGTAVGASAAQQGASVANDLYAELRKLPASAFAAEPEFQQLAREHGPDKARDILAAAATTRALLVGTGASVLSMKLVPGGDAIEKVFLPSHLKGGAAREAVKSSSFLTQPLTRGMQGNLGAQALEIAVQWLKHGTTGSITEGAEEASGAVAQGLELSRAGQDVKLGDMAGEAAGQAMAAGFAMDGAAGTRGANAAPRVQDQPTQPSTPPASPPPTTPNMARGQTAPAAPTASGPAEPPLPSPAATLAAALLPGYSEALQPGSRATWSNAASATRKAQAEAEILRQAEALPARDAATATTDTPSPAATSATPLPASTDGNRSSALQGAGALQQGQVNSDADQAETATQATATDPADTPAPTASVAGAQADANAATDTAPNTTQHGTAHHTAAAKVQPPATAPIDAQVQALDSGMLVVGGDQATILAHLQAGGVRGAEPFAGVTLVPVDQAALAQQVLSLPAKGVAPTGRLSEPDYSVPDGGDGQVAKRRMSDDVQGNLEAKPRGDASAFFPRNVADASKARQTSTEESHPDYTLHDDRVPSSSTGPSDGDRTHAVSSDAATPVILRRMGKQGVVLRDARLPDLGAGRARSGSPDPDHAIAAHPRNGKDRLSAREPAQPDDGYSVGTAYLAKGAFGGPRGGAPPQRDFTAPRATLVGLGIAERIAVAGSQALIGERVDSPEHLAELAQVYRDPRYETFRVFFIKDGKVVHATGVSARLPDRTPMVPAGMTEAEYLAQFREGMRRTAAQGYYILHNHPSGNPQPSPEDLELTKHLARQVPGMLAHVVINSNKYAVVTPQDAAQRAAPEAMVHLKHFGPDMLLRASKPMAALGETIQSSDALAMVGKSMQKPGWITLVGIGSDSRVRAIAEAPSNIFARSPAYLAASVRRFSRMSGSAQVFAVGDAGDINNSPVRRAVEAGILRDAVTDLGQSLAEGGRMPARRNDRAHFRDNTESANGQQPEFSNAHPTAAPVRVEMQRDGTLMVKGDPAQLQERLRQGGVDRVLRREGGVVVGLDQVRKARQLLQQPPSAPASAGPSLPSLPGQQFSRSAPDQASQARGLPSKPATVQSVRAAVAKLTNSMGLLAEGRGRVVVATSADIQAHWEPLVGEVDMGSPDSGLAQGFYDPNSKTVFLIADHIEAGQEMAVAAHELVHKHGKAVLGEAGWRQLHEVIGSWANRPEGSLERQVYDEAAARVQASRPAGADETSYSSEELFPYAVQVAIELGVQPTALMPNNSVQGWLARVRASLKDVIGKLTGNPQAFDGQDLVDLAFGIAQLERSASAPPQNGLERPNGSAPSAPYLPIQMSRDAGKDGAGAAPEKGPLGSENNPRPVPLTDFKVRITTDNDPSNAITMLVDGEYVVFASIEIKDGNPILAIGKNGQKKSGEYVKIDAYGVTEAILKAVISYYIETTGSPPIELPGSLAYGNLENFQKEFDKHREINHNGTMDDWAQSAIREMSFGRARQKLGYGFFEIELFGSVNVGDLKGVPKEVNIIARRY